MKISDDLKKEAISKGLCKQWTDDWHDETLDTLCEKYVDGIDFCISNDYPSTLYMKKNFDGIMQKHGIFVDDKINIHNLKRCVINGVSIGKAVYDGFSVGKIYLRHHSALNLKVEGMSKVFISMFDDCILNAECGPLAKLYIYRYGGDLKCNEQNNIFVRNEHIQRI